MACDASHKICVCLKFSVVFGCLKMKLHSEAVTRGELKSRVVAIPVLSRLGVHRLRNLVQSSSSQSVGALSGVLYP